MILESFHFHYFINSNMKTCNFCSKSSPDLKVCGSCKYAHYCSRECQKQDWDIHQGLCNKLRGITDEGARRETIQNYLNPVLVRGTPEVFQKMTRLQAEEEKIMKEYHRPTLDDELGCPNIPSEAKIQRYFKALQLYDDSTDPLCNSAFNTLIRNTDRFLKDQEKTKLYLMLKKNKVGSFNK